MPEVCKNCAQETHGHFCSNCGQPAHTHPIDWQYLGHEIQHGLFHVDRGIFYTTKCLLFHPGYTVQEFIAGKRARHFKPLAYLLIVSTVYLILSSAVGEGSFLDGFFEGMTQQEAESKSSSLQSVQAIFLWLRNHAVYLTILSIPLFALASKWAFLKLKYNYVEHLILHCYLTGLRSVLYMAVLPFYTLAQDKAAKYFIGSLQIFIAVFVTLWAFAEFFKPGPFWKVLLRSLLFLFWLSLLFMVVAALLVIIFKSPSS